MTLNPMQQVMLTVLMGPEDPQAFAKFQKQEGGRKYYNTNLKKIAKRQWSYRDKNREKIKAQSREYRNKNREKIKAQSREYRNKNREKIAEWHRDYYNKNRENINEQHRDYYNKNQEKILGQQRTRLPRILERRKTKYQTDPNFKVSVSVRIRIRDALFRNKTHKASSTTLLIGCTFPELREHLEKQFRPGMTWENHGPVWHVDHVRPCASFDLSDPEQQKICFHYSNLQPLFAEENLRKGAKY